MSLRMRLFLIFGGVVACLIAAQWWMLRAMTSSLEAEVDDVAFTVGSDVAAFFAPPGVDEHRHAELTRRAEAGRTVVAAGHEIDLHEENRDVSFVFHTNEEKVVEKRTFTSRIYIKPDVDARQKQVVVFEDGRRVQEWTVDETLDEPPIVLHQLEADEIQLDRANAPDANAGIMVEKLNLSLLDQGEEGFLWVKSPSLERRIPIPKSGLSTTLASLYNRFFLGSMAIMTLGLAVVAMFAHRFALPLRRLATTAQQVGAGRLGAQVVPPGVGGEVGIAITEFNQMSRKLEELDAAAQRMRRREYLSELGEIADGLAHTIRNPLNTLGLSVDQLSAMVPDDRRAGELAVVARQQIRRIDQWIRSFLALASQGSAETERVNLSALLHDIVLEVVQDPAATVGVDLDLPEQMPRPTGVSGELRAVIQALVVNAVEASPAGTEVRVTVREASETALCIEVADEGPGIPPEIREKLFTPHVTTKVTGSGMGLFLARRIITTRYDGSLELLDRAPAGTVARLILPLERADG